jgi:hypothetical protein
MKKIVLLFMLFLGFIGTQQAQTLEQFFDKYSKNDKFTYVSVGKGMMNAIENYADLDEESESIIPNSVKILTLEDISSVNAVLAKQIIAEIINIMNTDNFEKTLEVRDKGDETYIYSKKYENQGSDQLLIDITDEDLNIIWTRDKKSK